MSYTLQKDIDASLLPDTAAAATLALLGMSCARNDVYYVQSGLIKAHHPVAAIPPLVYDDSADNSGAGNLQHRVIINAIAPTIAGTTSDGNGNGAVNILGVDHYNAGDSGKMYSAGYTGAATNFTPSATVNFAIPGNQIVENSAPVSNPSAPFTTQLTNLLSDGSTSTLEVIVGGTTVQQAGLTQEPGAGLAGLLLNDPNGANGVSRLRIYKKVPGGDMGVDQATGPCQVAGNLVHIDAPVITLADGPLPAAWQWQLHRGAAADPEAIEGASGTKSTSGDVIADLEYEMADDLLDNTEVRFSIRLSDGSTIVEALSYFETDTDLGAAGVFAPAYAPEVDPPTLADLQALAADLPAGSETLVGLVGDSHTEKYGSKMQDLFDVVCPGKINVFNGGHNGARWDHWFPDTPHTDGQPWFSQLAGEDTRTNYDGMLHALTAAMGSGKKGMLSVKLGTNYPSPIGTFLTDPFTFLDAVATDFKDFNGPGQTIRVVLGDMIYRFKRPNSEQVTFYSPILANYETIRDLFGNNGHLMDGTREARYWSMNHFEEYEDDGIHLNDTTGTDALMHFDAKYILLAAVAAWTTGGAAPLQVAAVVNGAGMDVSWTPDPLNTSGKYLISRGSIAHPRPGLDPDPVLVASVDAPTTAWHDPGPRSGANYYRVSSDR